MSQDRMNNSLFKLLLKNEKEKEYQIYLRQPVNGVWREFTWRETMQQARKVAAFLQKLGLKKGAHISIISKNCVEWFITDFGICLAGMVSVPLFPNQNEENTRYILEHGDVELVFVGRLEEHQKVRSFIPEHFKTVGFDYYDDLKVDYKWSEVMATEPLKDPKEPDPDDLYTIIYSSGTSGTPKGSMFTHRSISNYLSIFPQDLKRLKKLKYNRLISYMPLAHVYERAAVLLSSATHNAEISFTDGESSLIELIKEVKPTLFTSVPKIWSKFQNGINQVVHQKKLNFLLKIPFISSFIKKKIIKSLGFEENTLLISGAAHLPVSVLEFFDKLDLPILEGYGQTENLAYATITLPLERRYGYVGTPRKEVQIRIGEESELILYSPCLMLGYYKEEEATKSTFTPDGWLRTGDIAEIDSQGRVKILGRLSEKFKNQTGEFVSPEPIEREFTHNPYIEQLCLVGRGLSANLLLVTLNRDIVYNDRGEIERSLKNTLFQVNSKLIKHEKVEHIIVFKDLWTIDNDFITPTNKVKRKILEKQYEELIQFASVQVDTVIWE